ncbi:MAG: hypothetical protein HC890_08325 [Chloroflexaceae bacterium]|nr:hypothetical protein [Chloroflexaceae bacterium]
MLPTGRIALVGRCATLNDEVALALGAAGLGQSAAIALGDEGLLGLGYPHWLQFLQGDERTDAVVLSGQASESAEAEAAHYIARNINKPVVAYLVGRHAQLSRRYRDATAIASAHLSYTALNSDTNASILAAFGEAQIPLADSPAGIAEQLRKILFP